MMNRYTPVDVICKFIQGEKEPVPLKVRMPLPDESRITVDVDEVLDVIHETPMSNYIVVYRCRSTIDGRQTTYELHYWATYLKWEIKLTK